jgi:hypothetical protein
MFIFILLSIDVCGREPQLHGGNQPLADSLSRYAVAIAPVPGRKRVSGFAPDLLSKELVCSQLAGSNRDEPAHAQDRTGELPEGCWLDSN